MEYSSETLNVEQDPRFLFDISFFLNIDSNQDDIDARLSIAKEAVKKGDVANIQEKKECFARNNIAMSEYNWIDTRDYTTCYFIWYCLLISIRAKSKTNEETQVSITDFEAVFSQSSFDLLTVYVPTFPSETSKLKTHTIIFLHYLFTTSKIINASAQKSVMDEIKKQYLDFKRSHFFKLTNDENRDRASWTLSKLESNSAFLPVEIPSSNTAQNLSLAISLFLWGKNSFFKHSIYFDESSVSKSEYLHKLNLSWNQFKHRENNKRNKIKAYNFEMEESLQQKIDYLSKKLDMKKNKLIEHLVTKEYKEQHQKEKE